MGSNPTHSAKTKAGGSKLEKQKKKEIIKAVLAVAFLVILICIVGIMMIRYSVEGEKDMPFYLSKITMISTAEGVEHADSIEKWNMDIYQNNDIYFSIEKSENADEDETIKSVSIENIQITKTPAVGAIKSYMPNCGEGRAFTYTEDYVIQNQSLTYQGGTQTDLKMLQIGNQGGNIAIRFTNTGIRKLCFQ